MSKPEFSRPFNLADAKAGHPIQTVAGDRAEVFKYDHAEFANFPLVGVINHTRLCYWTEAGAGALGVGDSYQDNLVMAPIGTIDGKPVFIGDELVYISSGRTTFVEPDDKNFSHCRWPALTPAYPVTLMTDDDLVSNYNGGGPVSHKREYQEWRRIANAALRHAIDAGQLVLPDAAPSDDLLMKVAKEVYCRATGQEHFLNEKEEYFRSIIASVTGAKDAKEGAK